MNNQFNNRHNGYKIVKDSYLLKVKLKDFKENSKKKIVYKLGLIKISLNKSISKIFITVILINYNYYLSWFV